MQLCRRMSVEASDAWQKSDQMVICAGSCSTPRKSNTTSLPNMAQPTCRACKTRIENVRIGIIFNHKDGFILMRWFHLGCTKPPAILTNVEGLDDPTLQPYHNLIHNWLYQTGSFSTTSTSAKRSRDHDSVRPDIIEASTSVTTTSVLGTTGGVISPIQKDSKRTCAVLSPAARSLLQAKDETQSGDIRNHFNKAVMAE